jgi:hypothetical protein
MYRTFAILCVLSVVCATTSVAQNLLVDRGLPQWGIVNGYYNINNYSASNPSPYPGLTNSYPRFESNCDWGWGWNTDNDTSWDGPYSQASTDYLLGDDFTLNSASRISTIRVWMVGGYNGESDPLVYGFTAPMGPDNILGNMLSNLSLYLGPKDGTLNQVVTGAFTAGTNTNTNPNISITQVWYNNGETFYGSNTARPLYQVDFNVSNLGLTYTAGTSLSFAVWGDPATDADNGLAGTTYLHCTDAATANAPQQDADNLVDCYYSNPADESLAYFYQSYAINGPAGSLGPNWVEPQDVNVQVFGSVVPEPTALTLLAAGLVGLLASAWRKRK